MRGFIYGSHISDLATCLRVELFSIVEREERRSGRWVGEDMQRLHLDDSSRGLIRSFFKFLSNCFLCLISLVLLSFDLRLWLLMSLPPSSLLSCLVHCILSDSTGSVCALLSLYLLVHFQLTGSTDVGVTFHSGHRFSLLREFTAYHLNPHSISL